MGETPDVFAVSGKQAMQAKLRRPFEDKIWKSSGYPELEAFISRIVTSSPSRRQVLRDVRDATSRALRRIEDQIDSSSRTVERKTRVLRDLENEIDHQRDAYGSEVAQQHPPANRTEEHRDEVQAYAGRQECVVGVPECLDHLANINGERE